MLIKQTNPKGDAIQYEYDAKGNLAARRQLPATGASDAPLTTTFSYDSIFNQLVSVTDPTGRATNFMVDEKGNITRKCAADVCESYEYNERGQIVSATDGEGNADTYLYNDAGQLVQITRGAREGKPNLTNRFTYNTQGNLTSFTDGRRNVFNFDVNTLNQVTSERGPSGYRRSIEYDANNNVVRIAGRSAVETRFTYNILDRVTTKREMIDGARSALTEYQYDLNENLVRIVEPEGNGTCTTYDERDLPYQITKGCALSEASAKTFSYDEDGHVKTMRDGSGNVLSYEYDGFGRLEKIDDPLGGVMEAAYDEVSNITSITRRGPPTGGPPVAESSGTILQRTEFIYDSLNRLTSTRQEINTSTQAVTQYAYDKNSRLTQTTDPNNHISRFVYDGADRLISKTDALGNGTQYRYDGNNNLLSVASLEGEERFTDRFEYDDLNRLTRREDDEGHATTYEYDSRNNLIATTDPKDTPGIDDGATTGEGNRTEYAYDGLNRLIEKTQMLTDNGAGNGAPVENIETGYRYDDNSRLTEIRDANGHVTRFAYDALNRQVEVKLHNNQTYTKRYDKNGNLIKGVKS